MNGISLFSGAGIGETYLDEIGINIIAANEIVPRRAELYKYMYPNSNMVCGDFTDKVIFNEVINNARYVPAAKKIYMDSRL